jgi:hypothetical protein
MFKVTYSDCRLLRTRMMAGTLLSRSLTPAKTADASSRAYRGRARLALIWGGLMFDHAVPGYRGGAWGRQSLQEYRCVLLVDNRG